MFVPDPKICQPVLLRWAGCEHARENLFISADNAIGLGHFADSAITATVKATRLVACGSALTGPAIFLQRDRNGTKQTANWPAKRKPGRTTDNNAPNANRPI